MLGKRKLGSVDVVGVDGCKTGWYAVKQAVETGDIAFGVFRDIDALFRWAPAPAIIAIDMPIGLSSVGKRASDSAARKLLDKRRKSSVFPTPVRQTLSADNYAAACTAHHHVTASNISKQAFNLLPKIKALDDHLCRSDTDAARVFEVHPELSFMLLQQNDGGAPGGVIAPKRTVAGHTIRRALLESRFDNHIEKALKSPLSKGASRDDILDAFAALWSARRIADNIALTVLEIDEMDALGLKMNIRY